MESDAILRAVAGAQKYPQIFVTISGAHLYGFPSPDSDYDLRGVHVLPVREVVGLETGPETLQLSEDRGGLEVDLVTHDAKKFFQLLLKKNGYVLEQLYSPLVVQTTAEHAELKEIAAGCVTRYHYYHYRGFAETEWKLLAKEDEKRIKPLLYVYRVLLSGIHLMRTGEVEANLRTLSGLYGLNFLEELIVRKLEGAELSILRDADMEFHTKEYLRLQNELERAGEESSLPERASRGAALNDLLIRVRGRNS